MQAATQFLCRALVCASLALPGAALSQPYVTAKLGYANTDFSLGQPYNGVVDDSAVTYGFDAGFGFGSRMAVEFGANGYGGLDGRATPCRPGESDDVHVVDRAALYPRVRGAFCACRLLSRGP